MKKIKTLLPVMYHGTTKRLWGERHDSPSNLHPTSDRNDAENYADELTSNEGGKRKGAEAVVVEFTAEDIDGLVNSEGVKINTDWGWVDALESQMKNEGKQLKRIPSRQKSLRECHGICLSGFSDAFKSRGKITPLKQGGRKHPCLTLFFTNCCLLY